MSNPVSNPSAASGAAGAAGPQCAAPAAPDLPETMAAAVLAAPRQWEIREVLLPQPAAHEVLVRVEGCGVCGSNLPVWEGRPWFNYPLPPGQPGHEAWGHIVQPGSDAQGLQVGDRVAMLSYAAFAPYDIAAASAVVQLPHSLDGQPFPAEPLACAMNVFARSGIRIGDTVAVIGIGFLGAILTSLAANAGARVIAITRRPFALELAARAGAAHTLVMDDHWRLIEAVKRLTNDQGCDCVIEAVGRQWPLDLAAHSCVLSWWQAVKGEAAPASWDRYAVAVRRGLQAADLVVAPTHAMLDALAAHYGPLPDGRVIYNGRDGHCFTPAPKEPFVLAVGRLWDEAKNVQALDCTAAEIRWPVYVAGANQHPDGGQRLFAYVHPLGRLAPQELAGWFGRAAVYALPARYEPFGLSVLEAALSGCALVLGDIRSLREVWGEAALYIAPDDPPALAEAINRLAADQPLRLALARKAQERAQQYTETAMAAGYWQAYQSLRAETAAPAPVYSRPAQVFRQGVGVYQPSAQLGR